MHSIIPAMAGVGLDFATIGDVCLVDHFGALLFGRIRRNCAWRSV
jgi:hypothetical protein